MTFKGPPMSCLKSGVALLGHGVSTFAKYKVLVGANVRRAPDSTTSLPPFPLLLQHGLCILQTYEPHLRAGVAEVVAWRARYPLHLLQPSPCIIVSSRLQSL